jgi:prepilin-type N-terminal cleavage/methylation domain-containing protein
MHKLFRNKKGVSLFEMIAAIAILGIASSTLTSMIITSYRGQLRAQQYVLAEEIAKTYEAMLAKDIDKNKLGSITADEGSDYKTFTSDATDKALMKSITRTVVVGENEYTSDIYNYLYGSGTLQLNGKKYDINNVTVRIRVLNAEWAYYKTEVSVTYSNDRQVTYSGTHLSDLS